MTIQPWMKSYPPSVRWDAPLELCPVQSILEHGGRALRRPAGAQFMDKRISYAELDALANRAAAGFQKLGVRPGVHVGLYLPNTPHYVIAFFGVLKAGGTVVNYSPLDALHGSSSRSTTARPTFSSPSISPRSIRRRRSCSPRRG